MFFWYWYSRRSKSRLSVDFSGIKFGGRGLSLSVYDTSSSLVVDFRYYFNVIYKNRRLIHAQECRFVVTRSLALMKTNRSQKPSVRLNGFVEWWLYEECMPDIQMIRKKTLFPLASSHLSCCIISPFSTSFVQFLQFPFLLPFYRFSTPPSSSVWILFSFCPYLFILLFSNFSTLFFLCWHADVCD